MFGHQDDTTQQLQNGTWPDQVPAEQAAAPTVNPALPPDNSYVAPAASQPVANPGITPLLEEQAADGYVASPVAPTTAPAIDTSAAAPAASNDLLDIKQHALQQLSPLVGHLEQTPEEKFRTTMMMIQASDDQSLISVAYEAANKITDEKARAQALLDIVNEINYFTQH